MKTRVAKLVAPRRIELFEEELPETGDRVQLKITTGICGSDLHYFRHGGLGSFKSQLPMELGHEVAGILESPQLGYAKDTILAVEPAEYCHRCTACWTNRRNLCANVRFMGNGLPGGFRDYLAAPESRLYPVESIETGVLLEPLSVAAHALSRVAGAQKRVLVVGCGVIGLMVMQTARKEAAYILAADPLEYRTQAARNLGLANEVVRLGREVRTLGPISLAIDCSGTQQAINYCFDQVSPGGAVVLVGIPEDDLRTYNPHQARTKELTVYNVRRSSVAYASVAKLLDKRLAQAIVTHRFPLEKVQEAFELASEYKDGAIKVLVE